MRKTQLAITIATTALVAPSAPDSAEASADKEQAPATSSAARELTTLSRAKMRAMIAKIERAERSEPEMGAMCYKMAKTPERAEYVCPTCAERTLHTARHAWCVERELGYCRRLFHGIPGHEAMTLDESSFCRKCRSDAEMPGLCLTIRFDDGMISGIERVTSEDPQLLSAALSGKLSVSTRNDGKDPLKDSLVRLRKLLGEKAAK